MAILANDIKLAASRVMDDVPEGGGGPTATVIVDGASNSIFPDISELDRAGGDVSFRQVFVHVQTDNTDTYLGANVIVAESPADPNVSVTLFATGETFEERSSAAARVESYLVAGPEYAGFLLESHIAGQRSIQLFQRPTETVPNVGQTIILIYHEGLSDERLQYVRIIGTSAITRTYTDQQGKVYDATVVACDLSDPLRLDFPGSPPSSYFTRNPSGSKVRETSVGDAAVYSSVASTTASAAIGDLSLTVDSVFTQLVPSAQTEIPLVDQSAAGQSLAVTPASDGTVSYTTSAVFNSTTALSLGNAITPGSIVITTTGGALTDAGGQLYDGASVIGLIDYARGTIMFPNLATPYNGAKTIACAPAAAPVRISDTAQIAVTPESRSYNYILTVLPTPAAGSAQVSYRAQGRWYDLRDNGGGVLRGSDASYGVGSVNYATGAIAVTLGALPDAGSAILFAWATKANYINRADADIPAPSMRLALAHGLIEPETVTISWNDGTDRTASDDGKGSITGDASGAVNYVTGLIRMTPANLPTSGQTYQAAYSLAEPGTQHAHAEIDPARELDTTLLIDLAQTNITPGTVRMDWPVSLVFSSVGNGFIRTDYEVPPRMQARDDGNGHILDTLGRVAGSINYSTGIVQFQPDGPVIAKATRYVFVVELTYGGAAG